GNFMDGLDMALYGGDLSLALERANQFIQPYHAVVRELQVMEKPVLAMATGMTAGPGMSFLLACDLVIAARSAKFNCKFANYAMTPDGACAFMLARRIGVAKANELLMLSDDFTADDAERWGLINKVVDDAKVQGEAFAWLD